MNLQRSAGRRRDRGFSLMEMIGVLAIMAIMAGALAPSLVDSIDEAYAAAEEQSLATLAESLEKYITENKRIPSPTAADWTAALALYSALPVDNVASNQRNFNRALYFDPRFFTASDTVFTGFTQAQGLSAPPVSPRAMLVSDLTRNAPTAPTTSAAFNAIWDQDNGASVMEGRKVKVLRMNFAALFHRLILNNKQQGVSPAYSLEGGAQVPIPAATAVQDGSMTRYVIVNTQLNLHQSPYPLGAMASRAVVTDGIDFLYQNSGSDWFWARP